MYPPSNFNFHLLAPYPRSATADSVSIRSATAVTIPVYRLDTFCTIFLIKGYRLTIFTEIKSNFQDQ